jgi:predicted kinase
VIAIGGLPGTGKSTLARALAPALGSAPGALIPRSDEIRKGQHGGAPEQRLPSTAYTPAKSAAVFAELGQIVEIAVKGGQTVIADATFMNLPDRSIVEAAAARAGVPFLGIWLTAPLAELERRIAGRKGDASDATVDVLRSAAADDPGPGAWHAVDASDRIVAQASILALAKH